MRVTLLGTGVPNPNPQRRGPSQIVTAGGERFLVDAGSGVVCQLVSSGMAPESVDQILITHHHSDHNIDLGHFLLTRWIFGDDSPLHVWGPRGTQRFVDDLLRLHDYDIQVRRALQRGRPGPKVEVHEIEEGMIYRSPGVTITAFLVEHLPVEPALGFRFDGDGRSIALSGDTRPCANLVERCRGVDVLVHECVDVARLDIPRGFHGGSRAEREKVLASLHTLPDQVGKVAAEAGAKTLVTSHMVPATAPDELRGVIARDFPGRIIVGEDLMEIEA